MSSLFATLQLSSTSEIQGQVISENASGVVFRSRKLYARGNIKLEKFYPWADVIALEKKEESDDILYVTSHQQGSKIPLESDVTTYAKSSDFVTATTKEGTLIVRTSQAEISGEVEDNEDPKPIKVATLETSDQPKRRGRPPKVVVVELPKVETQDDHEEEELPEPSKGVSVLEEEPEVEVKVSRRGRKPAIEIDVPEEPVVDKKKPVIKDATTKKPSRSLDDDEDTEQPAKPSFIDDDEDDTPKKPAPKKPSADDSDW